MRLDDLVQEHYEHMSENDRRIWQYIYRHKNECRSMTLHELADACQVSHTTVLRFLQLIGMDGYNDFKAFLKWDSLNQPGFNQRSIEENCFNLSRTISSIQQADCLELFYRMEQAGKLYAYGSGAVQKSVAKIFKNFLILSGKLLHVIEGQEERIMALRQVQKGDVIFLFSVSGNNPVMNEYAQSLRDKGLFLAAICQDGANDLSKICHFYFPFFTQKIDVGHDGLSFYSSAGMLPIAEILTLRYMAYQAEKNISPLPLE